MLPYQMITTLGSFDGNTIHRLGILFPNLLYLMYKTPILRIEDGRIEVTSFIGSRFSECSGHSFTI